MKRVSELKPTNRPHIISVKESYMSYVILPIH